MTRKEAIEWLEDIKDVGCETMFRDWSYEIAIDKAIEALQADTVEVVRCKDCIYHDDFFVGAEGSLLCWKGGTDRVVNAMGYCECGERIEE